MNDPTPDSSSLPPLGSVAPSGPTPPPPPPPLFSMSLSIDPVDEMEQPTELQTETETEFTPVVPEPATAAPSRQRRSLLFALVAILAVGGVVAGIVIGAGGDSSGDAASTGVETPEGDGATVGAVVATTVAEPATTVPATTVAPTTVPATTEAPTTTQAPTTTEAPTTTQAAPTFPTLPDGSPEPILAIYDGSVVRVSGWVPSEEKAAQLEGLALANSTDPAAQVDSTWSIDPLVPLSIGTRVIEMNSPRFPAGSADVTPEHAAQLDRVAGVMNLLPNVTVTVIGHADQVGDEIANYILSEARAVSVVRYLVSQGIAPARLSARAVGEQDLLAEDESEASLALNRRTEFVFYGLLAD